MPNEYLTAAQEILFDGAMADLADRLKSHGLTRTMPVSEVISMNLADTLHDRDTLDTGAAGRAIAAESGRTSLKPSEDQ